MPKIKYAFFMMNDSFYLTNVLFVEFWLDENALS